MTTEVRPIQVGEVAILEVDYGFDMEVRIVEVRTNWGRRDMRVQPVAGRGERWVQEGKLRRQEGS